MSFVETIHKTAFDEFRHHRGATSYHPKMMLKVILYAYTQSVFSGRKIEKLLNDSIRMDLAITKSKAFL